jgi:hypothetical protein
VSAAQLLGPVRLELQNERLSRRLPKMRYGVHSGAAVQYMATFAPQKSANIVDGRCWQTFERIASPRK